MYMIDAIQAARLDIAGLITNLSNSLNEVCPTEDAEWCNDIRRRLLTRMLVLTAMEADDKEPVLDAMFMVSSVVNEIIEKAGRNSAAKHYLKWINNIADSFHQYFKFATSEPNRKYRLALTSTIGTILLKIDDIYAPTGMNPHDRKQDFLKIIYSIIDAAPDDYIATIEAMQACRNCLRHMLEIAPEFKALIDIWDNDIKCMLDAANTCVDKEVGEEI